MCGIAGIINKLGRREVAFDLNLMSSAMEHRGPDDLGFMGWRNGGQLHISRDPLKAINGAEVAFAHRRLSIIDEGEGGWQPMATADRRFVITYNGEIYNYVELKTELEGEGVSFASHSDTEVLLRALATWGVEKTLPKLNGMFAFAMLDTVSNTVTLARDPFGIKPLYYAGLNSGLVFASEIPQLLTLSGINRTVDASALYDYLRFGLTDRGEHTLFSSVKHLPPAHFAVVDLNAPSRVNPERYWRAELRPTLDITFDEAADELRRLFMDSVALHLRADVSVGAALSGGLDSSAVVGAMRILKGPELDLHAFTFIAPGTNINEEQWADMAAQHVDARHHKISLTGQQLAQDIDNLIITQGEPFGTTSIFAQNRVFKLAHDNGIKVTLDGQGADEILAGYMPFLAARLASMLKSGQLVRGAKFIGNADNKVGTLLRAMRFLLPSSIQGPARSIIGEGLVPCWMDKSWLEKNGVTPEAPQKPVSGEDVLRHELMASLTDRVLPSLLRYQDRNSMAHSVESRVPFLTTKLVDFLYSLPEEFLVSDAGITKVLFRSSAQGLMPDEIIRRRDKIGFAAPEETWLRDAGSWVEDVLSSDTMSVIPAFDHTNISNEIDVIKSGKKRISNEVWRWANIARWAKIFDVKFTS
ncbi:asparagine synthase (glutamine-hydrolyzing) [Alphaproteobacteria bacterium]|nr:asparagine synthase (glutamine-hydrolyzing) [Alphaproteobacteria bacterium]